MVRLNDEAWRANWHEPESDSSPPQTGYPPPLSGQQSRRYSPADPTIFEARAIAERVFFVPRSRLLSNEYPHVEIVLLIDAAFIHRYLGVRFLDVSDAPDEQEEIESALPLTAVFPIDRREYV